MAVKLTSSGHCDVMKLVAYFRESYGYISQKWKDPPSDDSKFTRKRAMQINVTLQCGKCEIHVCWIKHKNEITKMFGVKDTAKWAFENSFNSSQ